MLLKLLCARIKKAFFTKTSLLLSYVTGISEQKLKVLRFQGAYLSVHPQPCRNANSLLFNWGMVLMVEFPPIYHYYTLLYSIQLSVWINLELPYLRISASSLFYESLIEWVTYDKLLSPLPIHYMQRDLFRNIVKRRFSQSYLWLL